MHGMCVDEDGTVLIRMVCVFMRMVQCLSRWYGVYEDGSVFIRMVCAFMRMVQCLLG